MVVFRMHRTFFVFLKCTIQGGSKVDVLLIAFLRLWLKFCKSIDKYWIVPVRNLFYFHHWVNHTINATPPERLQQHPLLFTTNRTDRTFFVWRLNSARPSHPGHSTILLRSEIPCSMFAKLPTVATCNYRDHPTRSLYYCLFAPHT